MRKSAREKLIEAKKGNVQQPGQMTMQDLAKLLVAPSLPPEKREINPTQWLFGIDGEAVTGYMGPAGCAKTSTLMMKAMLRALLKPGFKGLVSRLDYNDLMGTTAKRLEEMVAALPKGTLVDRDKSAPMRWWIRPAVPDAPLAEFTFMGLKESLGSYEFTDAFVDEADEVEENRIHEVKTRLRAPDPDGHGHTLNLCYNPPSKTHWLYPASTGRDFQENEVCEPWIKVYRPQPRENARNLPADYYEKMNTLPAEMRQRLRDGEWGATFPGQPVYAEFKTEIHTRDLYKEKVWTPFKPILRFWDFGYNRPACIWAQLDMFGRLRVFKEIIGHMEEAEPFIRRCMARSAEWFPEAQEYTDYGDPAAAQHKDTGSTLAVLAKSGIRLFFRPSEIMYGVKLIRTLLERTSGGEPIILIDKRGCPALIDGFKGGYHLDKKGEKPHKDGFYDHPHDAFRYGIINLFGATGSMMPNVGKLPSSVAYRR